jgi:hypothetical protein
VQWAGDLHHAIRQRMRSWTLQEPEIERGEHQDDSDVYHQPRPESVSEKQDVHADHDDYQREHAKHDGCLFAHLSFLPRAAGINSEAAPWAIGTNIVRPEGVLAPGGTMSRREVRPDNLNKTKVRGRKS